VILALVALATGLLLGHTGFDVVPAKSLPAALPFVYAQLSLVLALLGVRLGRGLLRLSLVEIIRRSVPPLAFAAVALLGGMVVLPRLLAGLQRPFDAFHLPFAFVLSALALLVLRDLRRRPPDDVGSVFLTAIVLVGAVHSFAPAFVWSSGLELGVLWRGPLLVLGESGALGVATAVAALLLTRRLRLPVLAVGTVLFAVAFWLALDWKLWPPFAALGFGIALGRAGMAELPVPFAGSPVLCSEIPLLLLAGMSYAPDLWRESLLLPSLAWAVAVTSLALAARAWLPRGRGLVTGPGLLFLGLAVAVRLDPRMGPLGRVTIDFAVPAWLVGRIAFTAVQSRAATKIRSSESAR
jgi:hypothetical protein